MWGLVGDDTTKSTMYCADKVNINPWADVQSCVVEGRGHVACKACAGVTVWLPCEKGYFGIRGNRAMADGDDCTH